MQNKGISVIICTYNGQSRIIPTIEHLSKQTITKEIVWEIILVDNGSTDQTFAVVSDCIHQYTNISIRACKEPVIGKIYALHTGILQASYDYIIICDDDNWLSENYLETAFEFMEAHPQAAIIGGTSEAVFEANKPFWFDQYQTSFAVGKLYNTPTNLTDTYESLWGAGMVIRKGAYEHLMARGFQYLLTGGQSNRRGSGEDVELSWAMRLLGYQLWYVPELKLYHFMPAQRMKWSTLVEITKANGTASMFYTPYRYHYAQITGKIEKSSPRWWKELFYNMSFLINLRTWFSYFFADRVGNQAVLRIERQLSKIRALSLFRNEYEQSYNKISSLLNQRISSL